MLIIFDVDGTLLDPASPDTECFDAAIEMELGVSTDRAFWETLDEVTAEAIVRHAAANHPEEQHPWLCKSIRARYLAGLREVHETKPDSFKEHAGASALLRRLRADPRFKLAIATGDWRETILFKLAGAGVDVEGIPLCSSSDLPQRAEIIRRAAETVGHPLEKSLYVGDGTWDLKATQKLGIPLIAVGRKHEELVAKGAVAGLPDLEAEAFFRVLESVRPQA